MSEAPASQQESTNHYQVTEEYLDNVNNLLRGEKEWWETAGQKLGNDYWDVIQYSIKEGEHFLSSLKGAPSALQADLQLVKFQESLQKVARVAEKAKGLIDKASLLKIEWQNNDRLIKMVNNAITGLVVNTEQTTHPIHPTEIDRSIFSISVKGLLNSIANTEGGMDLAVILFEMQQGQKHAEYGTKGITEHPYDDLKLFLNNNKSTLDLRKYNADEWATTVVSVVNVPLREIIIDGRMFLNAAILSEFKNMYALAGEKKKLHQLCFALYTQLVKEINGDFAAQLTEKGKELYTFLQNPLATNTEPLIKSRLHSDTSEMDDSDVLNYDLIAENLFTILKDKNTNPPLNIGILAPWGRGKTSLMKLIKKKFDDERAQEMKNRPLQSHAASTLKDLRRWLKEPEEKSDEWIKPRLPFATVWFNPWNYQSTDMIWAGLANSVIEQVVEQIKDPLEREKFWMQLRLARIDRDEVRRDLQTRVVLNAAKIILTAFTAAVAGVLLYMEKITPALSVLGLGGIPSILAFLAGYVKPKNENISEAFSKYTKAPKYNEKLGTFHEVEADMNRVLNLCIDKEKPLVVFVDDLDRCSPSKIVEVVEAINVFISGKYNYKCYFILGMDAEVVAGALDVTYEKMKGKLATKESEQGSIGWYFLDKFIQLPFFIPVMSETKKKEYLAGLLTEKSAATQNNTSETKTIDKDKVEAVFKDVMAAKNVDKSKTAITDAGLSPAEIAHLDKLILQNQVQSEKQNEEIKQQIALYGQFVSSDPRSLKRFANLLRFHCGYQFLRMKKGQTYVEPKVLAKWLVLMLKFPQLVRWIQWDLENKSGLNSNAEEKAILFDQLIDDFISKTDNEKNNEFARWSQFPFPKELNQGKEGIKIEELNELLWFKSPNMFKILMNDYSKEDKFKNALDCNVW